MKPRSEAEWNEIYDLLVEEVGAPESGRGMFIVRLMNEHGSYYIFGGKLGPGGRLCQDEQGNLSITCYSEDIDKTTWKYFRKINLWLQKFVERKESERLELAPKKVRTAEEWGAVYDLLVAEAGAHPDGREPFLYHCTQETLREWRFQGQLGFGGKLYQDFNGELRIGCYVEDDTVDTRRIKKSVNPKLKDM